jgi:hypothetical protein
MDRNRRDVLHLNHSLTLVCRRLNIINTFAVSEPLTDYIYPEPASNTCKEIPYKDVNAITLDLAKPGKCRYTKSVHENAPNRNVFAEEFETLVNLSKDKPGFNIGIIHEYVAKDKINSVASDATAFYSRISKYNTLMLTTWEDNVEDNTNYARKVVAELSAFIIQVQNDTDNIGYGNYSTFSAGFEWVLAQIIFLLFCFRRG